MLLFSFLPSPYRGRTVWGKGRVKLYYRANKDISDHVMFSCLGVPHNGVLKMLSYVMVPPAILLNQHTTGDKRNISQPGLLCVPAKKKQGVYPIHPATLCLTADHKVCLLLCICSPLHKQTNQPMRSSVCSRFSISKTS